MLWISDRFHGRVREVEKHPTTGFEAACPIHVETQTVYIHTYLYIFLLLSLLYVYIEI